MKILSGRATFYKKKKEKTQYILNIFGGILVNVSHQWEMFKLKHLRIRLKTKYFVHVNVVIY